MVVDDEICNTESMFDHYKLVPFYTYNLLIIKNFLLITIKLKIDMLNKKEKTIAHIASAISVFSIQQNANKLPANISMIDFVLKTTPDDIKPDITIDLIDSIFSYVSATRFDT